MSSNNTQRQNPQFQSPQNNTPDPEGTEGYELRSSRERKKNLNSYVEGHTQANVRLILDDDATTAGVIPLDGSRTHDAVIKIPTKYIEKKPDDVPRRAFDKIIQYAWTIHEAGHIEVTDSEAVESLRGEYIKWPIEPIQKFAHKFWNVMEDGFMEGWLRSIKGDRVAKRIERKNKWLYGDKSLPETHRKDLNILAAVHTAAFSEAKYDTGSLAKLRDDSNDEWTFEDEETKQLFEWIYPGIVHCKNVALTEPDPWERTRVIFETAEQIIDTILESELDEDQKKKLDNLIGSPDTDLNNNYGSGKKVKKRVLIKKPQQPSQQSQNNSSQANQSGQQQNQSQSQQSQQQAGQSSQQQQSPPSQSQEGDDTSGQSSSSESDGSDTDATGQDEDAGAGASAGGDDQDTADDSTGGDTDTESANDDGSPSADDDNESGDESDTATESGNQSGEESDKKPDSEDGDGASSVESDGEGDDDDAVGNEEEGTSSTEGNVDEGNADDGDSDGASASGDSESADEEGDGDTDAAEGDSGLTPPDEIEEPDTDETGQTSLGDFESSDTDESETDEEPDGDEAEADGSTSTDTGEDSEGSPDSDGEEPAQSNTDQNDGEEPGAESVGTELDGEDPQSDTPDLDAETGASEESGDESGDGSKETESAPETERGDQAPSSDENQQEGHDGHETPDSSASQQEESSTTPGQQQPEQQPPQQPAQQPNPSRTNTASEGDTATGASNVGGEANNGTPDDDKSDTSPSTPQPAPSMQPPSHPDSPDAGRDEDDEDFIEEEAKRAEREQQRQERREREREQATREFEQTVKQSDNLDEGDVVIDFTSDAPFDKDRWGEATDLKEPLKPLLKKKLKQEEADEVHRGRRAGKPDPTRLFGLKTNNLNVMQQQKDGGDKVYCLILVLDRSGSMRDQIESAEKSLAAMALAAEELGIEVCIIDMFDSAPRVVSPFSIPVERDKEKLMTGVTSGGTPLTDVIELAKERLVQMGGRRESLLMSVADGKPNQADDYLDAIEDCRATTLGLTLLLNSQPGAVPRRVEGQDELYDQHKYIYDADSLRHSMKRFLEKLVA
jgi:hypothetical protein